VVASSHRRSSVSMVQMTARPASSPGVRGGAKAGNRLHEQSSSRFAPPFSPPRRAGCSWRHAHRPSEKPDSGRKSPEPSHGANGGGGVKKTSDYGPLSCGSSYVRNASGVGS
jgi:hypothetical protein